MRETLHSRLGMNNRQVEEMIGVLSLGDNVVHARINTMNYFSLLQNVDCTGKGPVELMAMAEEISEQKMKDLSK